MIYCPKCGTSTKLINEAGIANLSCPSCGVVWEKFLEAMANDALWPSIVDRDKHEIICPKCGYERYSSDSAVPRTKCPSCRENYAESVTPPPVDAQNADTKACEFCGERILAVAKKCKHCGSMLGADALSTVQKAVHSREVEILTRAGKIVDAIKRYRAETGVGLLEAKNYIESLVVTTKGTVPPPLGEGHDKCIVCPKCKSAQITSNRKGFSVFKAAVGLMVTPVAAPVGALFGMHGRNKIRISCLKCGHSWSAGE